MSENWLIPGAEAVVLQPYQRGALRAETVTIERILKRDVVVSNGDRFNKDSLRRQVGGTYGTTYYLVPPTDERVATTRSAIRLSRAKSKAYAAYDDWRLNKRTATEVAAAFIALAELEANS